MSYLKSAIAKNKISQKQIDRKIESISNELRASSDSENADERERRL